MNDATEYKGSEGERRNCRPRLLFIYKGKDGPKVPRDVTHATVDPSVKSIHDKAFDNCIHLVEVELNEGLEIIDKESFGRCLTLKSVKIPSTVKVINEGAFRCCDQLVEVELNDGLEKIERHAFEDCRSLKSMKIPSTVKVIGERAFSY